MDSGRTLTVFGRFEVARGRHAKRRSERLKIRKLRESALSLLSLINGRLEVDELKVGVINPDSSGLKLHGTRTESLFIAINAFLSAKGVRSYGINPGDRFNSSCNWCRPKLAL